MQQSSDKPKALGLDALVEDLFGLNIRGVKTIAAMFVRPKAVFEAARTEDWAGGKYTPSIRLVFSLLALMAFLSFIWAADNGSLRLALEMRVEAAVQDDMSAAEINNVVDEYLNIFAGALPLSFLLLQFLGASILFVWGKGTGFVTRMRLYFLTIVPSSFVAVLSIFAVPLFKEDEVLYFQFGAIFLTLVLDFSTAMRGGVYADKVSVRVMKSLLLAITTFSAMLLSQIMSTIVLGVMLGRATAG